MTAGGWATGVRRNQKGLGANSWPYVAFGGARSPQRHPRASRHACLRFERRVFIVKRRWSGHQAHFFQ